MQPLTDMHDKRQVISEPLQVVAPFQVWTAGDRGSLIAATVWLRDAVDIVLHRKESRGIVITEGTRTLWVEGEDGRLRDFAGDADDDLYMHLRAGHDGEEMTPPIW